METVGAARAGFLLARTRAAQSGQGSVDQGQELARSGDLARAAENRIWQCAKNEA
jgi:hypothetical protein